MGIGVFELAILVGIPLVLLFVGAIVFLLIRGSGKK